MRILNFCRSARVLPTDPLEPSLLEGTERVQALSQAAIFGNRVRTLRGAVGHYHRWSLVCHGIGRKDANPFAPDILAKGAIVRPMTLSGGALLLVENYSNSRRVAI